MSCRWAVARAAGWLVAVALLAACGSSRPAQVVTIAPTSTTVTTAAPVTALPPAPTTTAISDLPVFVVDQAARAESPVVGPDLFAETMPCPGRAEGEPRGVRNCNPGNLNGGTTHWEGEVACSEIVYADGTRNGEGRFACFADAVHGFRALVRTAMAYFGRDHITTLDGFFGRWAPTSDGNAPAAYAAAVARSLAARGYDVTVDADVVAEGLSGDCAFLGALAGAIALHENGPKPTGGGWYSADTVEAGTRLACG